MTQPSGVRRILVRANNWIGDVVMISPAVRAIREHYREARIAILAKGWVLEALRGNPCFDELIEYDHAGRHAGASGRFRLARELRRGGRIDLAVLFQKAFDAALIAWLAGARRRIGLATDARSILLTDAVPMPPAGTHHVEVFLSIARALGCPVRDSTPFFHLTDAARARAAATLESAGLTTGPLIALHAAASKPERAWHAERFAALARRLNGTQGAAFLLLGGASDAPLTSRIAAHLPGGAALVPSPADGLAGSAALLERCHLFIGNDSGPMHLAAALGVPTLGLFGPGSPRNTGPLGPADRVTAVGRDYPCSPCRQDFFHECSAAPSGKPFCLEEIGVEAIEREALRLLRGPARV